MREAGSPVGSPVGSPGAPHPVPPARGWPPPGISADTAHPARVYDYLLGGKDNFAADRRLGDAITAAMPATPRMARANRAFLSRAVRHLAAQAGIRQFLDIGAGIPAADNVHEVAQRAAPQARVLYVDNDPVVMAHVRALISGDPGGATAFIQADLRDPGKILADPRLHAALDLDKPVALLLVAILHLLADAEEPHRIVAELLDALPPGSYLTLSHATADFSPGEVSGAARAAKEAGVTFAPRTHAEVTAFLSGLDLVDPGVVPVLAWRPDGPAPADPRAANSYAAMARKT